jgi:hypothetical protein
MQRRRGARIGRGEIGPEPDGSVGQIAQAHSDNPAAGTWDIPPGVNRR